MHRLGDVNASVQYVRAQIEVIEEQLMYRNVCAGQGGRRAARAIRLRRRGHLYRRGHPSR